MIALPAVSLALTFPGRASADSPPPSTLPQPIIRISGNVLPALKQATLLRSTNEAANKPIIVTIILKRNDQKAFERYLHSIYDPRSPNYHHYLTQPEIAARFGPTKAAYEGLLDYMRGYGFRLLAGSKNRLTLTLRGTRAMAEHAFDVKILDYRVGKRTFYANDRNPALPANLAGRVQAVVGMADLARPHHTIQAISNLLLNFGFGPIPSPTPTPTPTPPPTPTPTPTSTPTSTPTPTPSGSPSPTPTPTGSPTPTPSPSGSPTATPTPSPTPPLVRVTPDGEAYDDGCTPDDPCVSTLLEGPTIGLLEFDNFQKSDVEDYLNWAGLPASYLNELSEVNVGNGVAPGPGQSEVLLDIDTVLTLAPGVPVVVFDGPFQGDGTSFQTMFQAMIDDGVGIISNSWAYCEDETTKADVDSIDSIFQTAAAAGITILNGSGDTGSTCLDGAQDTIAVPADSPNATAVGGTSLMTGPGNTYLSETWWNGQNSTPATGQGGFGISKFFPEPAYQTTLIPGAAGRSIPDVVAAADPAFGGTEICWAMGGGCPNGLLYGGTSMAAPEWAAFTAWLDLSVQAALGFLNPLLYSSVVAGSPDFHTAASMGSDPEHVGLGSPNLSTLVDNLLIAIPIYQSGKLSKPATLTTPTVGPVSIAESSAKAWAHLSVLYSPFEFTAPLPFIPADGTTQAYVVVKLRDANRLVVSGKTVSLTANGGSNAIITPSSAVTNVANGAAVFSVTDLTPETVTFTATDTTDGITLAQQPTFVFGVPPAASGGISPSSQNGTADGSTTATITVTLKDSLGRPTPGKLITLNPASGHSVIIAPSPAVTDSNGEAAFNVTDTHTENITYTATDVTDGDVPVPGNATIDFSGGSGCSGGTPQVANGYTVNAFATGFVAHTFSFGNINFGCDGAWGMAFDGSGNLYVADVPTGNVYKFGPSGGIANATTLITPTPLGEGTTGLAIDRAGNLFASRAATTGDFTTGDVIQVNPSTGAFMGEVSSGLTCPWNLAVNPSSTGLFAGDGCSGGGADSTHIWMITGQDGPMPSTSIYADTLTTPNYGPVFAPNGTAYVLSGRGVVRISNAATPVVTTLSGISTGYGFSLAVGGMQPSGDSQFLLLDQPAQDGFDAGTQLFDLTSSTPTPSGLVSGPITVNNKIIGPDGCLYVGAGTTVYKITKSDGTCDFGPTTQPPSISLTPTSVSPNPAQGSSQTFTATLHYTGTLSGVPVMLKTVGANPNVLLANTNASGQATFNYTGAHQGVDYVVASATVDNASATSNAAQVTWGPGQDVTFLTLNPSPKGAMQGSAVMVTASLTDVSQNPPTIVSGQTVNFTLGGASCSGMTDGYGMASCSLTPGGLGMETLSASFAGTGTMVGSNASTGFTVLASGSGYVPNPAGTVALVSMGDSSGAAGATVNLGTFDYTEAAANVNDQTLSAATLAISNPSIFQSITLTPSSGSPVTVSSPDIKKMTTFNFGPALTVMPSQQITFTVTGVLKGSMARLELGGVAFAGVNGDLAVSNGPIHGLLAMLLGMLLLGAAISARVSERRRRVAFIAGLVFVFAMTAIGCSGGSGSSGSSVASSAASQQSVMSIGVTENGATVTTSGTPLTLGTIKKT